MIPRRLKQATLLAASLQGVFILTGQYHRSYDAYFHMFLGDHYLRNWWSLWEPRWYTGFEVTSYPPLVHQLIALLGGMIGVEAAFALLLWVVPVAYPAAIYRFSRIFCGPAAAGMAALGAAVLPSLYLTAHTFGQLPTLVSALLGLFGAAALNEFLRRGDKISGALATGLFATSAAAHHATVLFLPFLAGMVFLSSMLRGNIHKQRTVLRFLAFIFLAAGAAGMVTWPFWQWGINQEIQTPIDHISRHNYIRDPLAALLFFLPVYGWLIPLVPLAALAWLRKPWRKRLGFVSLVFVILFLLGLGDTTPLPRVLFGKGWAWLTYERFALWASLLLLPFFGVWAAWHSRRNMGRRAQPYWAGFMVTACLIVGSIPTWLQIQPAPINMQPIVDFLDKAASENAAFRYLTFGFGDQLALLSRLTKATTIDGSYHTARSLPELRTSGIGQIDSAYWIPGGMTALEPILQKSWEHGVRWGFVNFRFYQPVLIRSGWEKFTVLSNGIEVWENPRANTPTPVQPPVTNPLSVFTWGVLPLFALLCSSLLALGQFKTPQSQRVLATLQALSIGLLPIGLTFWYYKTLVKIEHPCIYFTYSDALFFLSDGLAALAILIYWIRKSGGRDKKNDQPNGSRAKQFLTHPEGWLLGICVWAGVSTIWSLDWRTSIYISLHLVLCFGLYLVLRDTPRAWIPFAFGCCAALVLQGVIGAGQAVLQSTAWSQPLQLEWPGELLPGISGASVVQFDEGIRWLRAYGTLPHPNLLGGFVLALVAGPLALFLALPRQHIQPLVFVLAALGLIGLTFSRGAALGVVVLGAGLAMGWKILEHKRLAILCVTGLATTMLLFLTFRTLFITRLGGMEAQTEQVSTYTRLWLIQRTEELIRERLWLGNGIGAFSLALSHHVADFYDIEPVHNIPLLVTSELGIPGAVLLAGLAITIFAKMRKGREPAAIVFSAALLGLATIGIFDHYLWTLAPGRLLGASMLGLWAGQLKDHG